VLACALSLYQFGLGLQQPLALYHGFEKYGSARRRGFHPRNGQTATALINYFNSSDEFIQVNVTADGRTFELFTQEEQFHFKDVKQLVRLDYTVFFSSLAVLVVLSFLMIVGDFRKSWRSLVKSYVWAVLSLSSDYCHRHRVLL